MSIDKCHKKSISLQFRRHRDVILKILILKHSVYTKFSYLLTCVQYYGIPTNVYQQFSVLWHNTFKLCKKTQITKNLTLKRFFSHFYFHDKNYPTGYGAGAYMTYDPVTRLVKEIFNSCHDENDEKWFFAHI
jgi:hypothetical protein